jgi:hypothetical protein
MKDNVGYQHSMTKEQEYQWLCDYLGMNPKAYVEHGLELIKKVNRKLSGEYSYPSPPTENFSCENPNS